jgi:cytochrome c5
MRSRLFAVVSAAVLLASCGRSHEGAKPPSATPAEIDFALRAEPSPPALKALFDRSCKNCHGVAGNGAPLVGQTSAWAPRIAARGPEGLLASVKTGRNAMPPRGLCPDCTDDDYRAIIAFMSAKPAPL